MGNLGAVARSCDGAPAMLQMALELCESRDVRMCEEDTIGTYECFSSACARASVTPQLSEHGVQAVYFLTGCGPCSDGLWAVAFS